MSTQILETFVEKQNINGVEIKVIHDLMIENKININLLMDFD